MNEPIIIKQDFLNSNIFDELNIISKNFIQNNLQDIYKKKSWKDTIKENENLLVCMHDLDDKELLHQLTKDIIDKTNFKPQFLQVRLHFLLPNSHVPWHIDNNKTGITVFLNNDWDLDHGGLFLYKDRNNNNNIKAILPEKNTAVIVRNGIIPHAVTILSNNSKIRRTLQLFIDNASINSPIVHPQSNNIIYSKKDYNTFLYKLIHVSEEEFSIHTCKEIIDLFNNSKELHHRGRTVGGITENQKLTTDLVIPRNNKKWEKYEKIISKHLQKALSKYVKLYEIFVEEEQQLYSTHFQVQKYDKNKGHFNAYHHDFFVDDKISSFRVITFIIYLNDITTGGETEFLNEIKIIPSAGKIVLFPAAWPYIHKGHMPISHDKYIITGWFISLNNC